MKELTIEITNYCPHECKYCSSKTTRNRDAIFIDKSVVLRFLYKKRFDRINISGGEPLAHPDFYKILAWCKHAAKDVVVYTNALTHIRYNANVIDGIYLEANLTVLSNVKQVHILKRIQQGREKTRPEVHFSRNFTADCKCDHKILLPDGSIGKAPCNKE